MAVILGKIRCYFCNQKKGVMVSIQDYGIYGEVNQRIFYHQECLEMVEIYAEQSGHILVDKAISANELYDKCIKYNKKIEENFRKKIERLKMKNFNRMIPRFKGK